MRISISASITAAYVYSYMYDVHCTHEGGSSVIKYVASVKPINI